MFLMFLSAILGSEVPGGTKYVFVHTEAHALQWLQLQVMTYYLKGEPINLCPLQLLLLASITQS